MGITKTLLGTYRTKEHVTHRRSKMRIEVWVGILLIVASIGAKGDGVAVGELDESKMDLKKTMADQKRPDIDLMQLDPIITAMQAKISALEESQATTTEKVSALKGSHVSVQKEVSSLKEGQATVRRQVSNLKESQATVKSQVSNLEENQIRCISGDVQFGKGQGVIEQSKLKIDFSYRFSEKPTFMIAMTGTSDIHIAPKPMKPTHVGYEADSLSASSVIVYRGPFHEELNHHVFAAWIACGH